MKPFGFSRPVCAGVGIYPVRELTMLLIDSEMAAGALFSSGESLSTLARAAGVGGEGGSAHFSTPTMSVTGGRPEVAIQGRQVSF